MFRRARTLLLAVIASLSCSAIAAPACIEKGGIGGTGRALSNGGLGGSGAPASGIGGTGAPASGIGGTGAPASGIGGTGSPVASGIGGTGAPARGIGGTGSPVASGIGGTGAPASGVGGTGAPVASGIGGTGAPESGIGGTGAPMAGGGIGGTGAPTADGGLGGTGIVGTITGFASVCINGVEVHFEAGTPVDMNAQPATIAHLAIGQVVAIQAGQSARGFEARSISIINAYEGPITDVGRDGSFKVMGQPVRVVQGRVPAGLRVGDTVRVGGLRAPGGELLATYLVGAPDLADASVAGEVANERRVGGVTVSRPLGGLSAALVRGRWSRDTLQAREILPDPATESLRVADRAIIEGIVQERSGNAVRLGGVDVSVPTEVIKSGGAPMDLRAGARVRITANRDAASELRAETVQILPDPRDLVETIERQRDSEDDGSGSDDRNRSGSDSGQTDLRSETRSSDDGDRTELRYETRSETGDEHETESAKQFAGDTRAEIKIEIESDGDASGQPQARHEREERYQDDGLRSESRERGRSEDGREQTEERVRSERYDEAGRRIERIESRTRDDGREVRQESRQVRDRGRVDRAERPERVERIEEVEKIERIERIEEPEKIERVERIEEPEKVERIERIEEPEKVERVERIEEPEKVERIETIEEPERIERVERIDEPEEIERIERVEEPEKIERVERIDEPEDVERIDKSGPGG